MPRGEPGKPKTPEQRARQAEAMRGRSASAATRAKLSEARRGVPKSAEHRAAISAALAGKLKLETVSYHGAHSRLGDASEHLCPCGKQARDWAYQHTCPNPLYSPEGWPYSADPADYLPMCRPCHKQLDAQVTA